MSVKTEVKLKTLSYVILYVPDTKAALPFYTEKLGMTVKLDDDGWIELESGAATLCLHSSKDVPEGKRQAMPTMVFEVENIDETYSQLKDKGIKFEKEPHEVCSTPEGKGYSADFTDPYGNVLSIYGLKK